MSDEDHVNRVQLGLRVDTDVRDAFEDEVGERYGTTRPYAGIDLEREFRFRLDESRLNHLWENVRSLADLYGQTDGEKKNYSQDRSETVVVNYRVAEDIRQRVLAYAGKHDFRSAGAFVESIMASYADCDSIEDRITDQTDRIVEAAEMRKQANDAQGRRVQTAASVLRNQDAFTLDDFFDVFDTHVTGIGGTTHARNEYLRDVLDELGYTWHPENEELYIPKEKCDGERLDRSRVPAFLKDQDDRRLAIEYTLFKKDIESVSAQKTAMPISKIGIEINANASKETYQSDVKAITESEAGFNYVEHSGDELITINRDAMSDTKRHELLEIARAEGLIEAEKTDQNPAQSIANASNEQTQTTDETPARSGVAAADGGEPDDVPADATTWVDAVAGEVSHIPFDDFEDVEKQNDLLRGKIATEKYAEPNDIDDETGAVMSDSRLDELEGRVTGDDLDAVRRELGLAELGEKDPDEIAEEADDVFDALEGADRARADGGRPVK